MGTAAGRRRALVITLAVSLLVLFLALATLNAFNLKFLDPASPTQTLVFIALSTLAFLLFVGVLVLLVRNVLKLYADQRSRVLGTRLRTRMLWGAVLVSLVPLVFMFAFSYLLMNRALERWFSQPVKEMLVDSNNMAAELSRYIAANARSEADSIAVGLAGNAPSRPAAIQRELLRHDVTLQGGFAIVYRGNQPVGALHVPQVGGPPGAIKAPPSVDTATDEDPAATVPSEIVPLSGPTQTAVLVAAQRNDGSVYLLNQTAYMLATAGIRGGLVVVGQPIPASIATTSQQVRDADAAYQTLFRERRLVRNLYMLLLLLITGVALFACCWLALHLSKQVTLPVEALADAMEAIAAGNYAKRVPESATDELGELGHSFNAMAGDLESARAAAEAAGAEAAEANAALSARRTELETIIETIPSGVATLSIDLRVLVANRGFSELLDPGGQRRVVGEALGDLFSVETTDALNHLLRRSHRLGSATAEMEMPSPSGKLHIAATVALLESTSGPAREHLGYVLVLDDATELLRAQKQSAWKEVARRVAHEIKNPLTPIALNAEQIRRHLARLAPTLAEHNVASPSLAVIERSSEIITSSVETMRSLVDQFSSLAQFPRTRPRPADVNTIIENALALFADRLTAIRIVRRFAPDLPLALADPESLKRALSNLIDNAAEAMHGSLLRELHVTTRALDNGMVEITIADTGPGLTDDMRERLFLPYFSTKQRGTGLGLSIAAQIMQEHEGSIRAEKNIPAGARFILELPAASAIDAVSEQPATAHEVSA
jgi:nitrogen fixation/metabolism regulation signal transduction histidine kinase